MVHLTARGHAAYRLFALCMPARWRIGIDGLSGLVLSEVAEVARQEWIEWDEVRPLVLLLEREWLVMRQKEREEKAKRKQEPRPPRRRAVGR